MSDERPLKLVVDTSIIIAALLKEKSLPYELITGSSLALYAPRQVAEEIEKHMNDILKKSELTVSQIRDRLSKMLHKIVLLDEEEFMNKLQEAKHMIGHRDVKDVPFVAVLLSIEGDGVLSYNKDFDELDAYGYRRYTPADLARLHKSNNTVSLVSG